MVFRAAEGSFRPRGGPRFDTKGLSLVGEVIYGSTTVDAGAGYERLSSKRLDIDRQLVSASVRTKTGVFSLSLEGHIGRVEGKGEVSVALGGQYDIARGCRQIWASTMQGLACRLAVFRYIEETKTVFSLRYSF